MDQARGLIYDRERSTDRESTGRRKRSKGSTDRAESGAGASYCETLYRQGI